MRRLDTRLYIGLLLIVAGIILTLQNLQLIAWGEAVWLAASALGALVFLGIFVRDRQHWWALIPGLALAGVAAGLAVELAAPGAAGKWTGPMVLGGIALGFLAVYVVDRQHWWAIIPGGVLATLAVVAGLGPREGMDTGGIFFVGLGLTFLVVALVPARGGRSTWAFIPAAILLVMGVLLVVGFTAGLNYIWPLVLILAGLLLLVRALRRKPAESARDRSGN